VPTFENHAGAMGKSSWWVMYLLFRALWGRSADGRYVPIAEAVKEVVGRNEELGERNEDFLFPRSSLLAPSSFFLNSQLRKRK